MYERAIVASALEKTYVTHSGLLRRERAEHRALRGLDLAVGRGELFGLLGPNGAGKTTTIKILTTLLLPTAGRAWVGGHDVVHEAGAVRRRIGFVLGGDRGLYWRLSGLDNLRYFADLYRIPPPVSRRRIPQLLEQFGLTAHARDRVELYSRGMKQRLHLARGLLSDPEILFLDEPTIGLDPVGGSELRQMVRELAQAGTTVLLTTHYMLEADAICDRIAIVNRGRIIAEGTPRSIKGRVQHLSVVELEVAPTGRLDLDWIRSLDGVSSAIASDREVTRLLTIHCTHPHELAARISHQLDGVTFHRIAIREPTLEDAYMALVAER